MTMISDLSRPIKMFEGKSEELMVTSLTSDDYKLIARLREKDQVSVDELRDGIRISAGSSWVGVLKFSQFEVHILPKHEGHNSLLAELIHFTAGIDALKVYRQDREFKPQGTNLLDVFVTMLADESERIVQRGIRSDYIEEEDSLSKLRGRLLISKQINERLGRFDRLECRYDEHSADITENKVILASLLVCMPKVKSAQLSARIRRLVAIFEDVSSIGSGFDFNECCTRIFYNRLNDYYRRSHDIAKLIMGGLGLEDIYLASRDKCYSFLFKMHELFEKFVEKLFASALKLEYKVLPKETESKFFWNNEANKSYASLCPDILISHKNNPSVRLPVDAKYKIYDFRNVTTADLYQTFSYAHAFGHGNHAFLPTALIVFPTTSEESQIQKVKIRRQLDLASTGELIIVPINIKNSLGAIRAGNLTDLLSDLIVVVHEVLSIAPLQLVQTGTS